MFGGLHQTIDNLASLHDGLAAVRANQSPLQTPESNAIAYRQKYEAATRRAAAPIDTNGRLEAYDAAQANVVSLTETSAA